jgi:HEAT repeat protein
VDAGGAVSRESEILDRLGSGEETLKQQRMLLIELRRHATGASAPLLRRYVDGSDGDSRAWALRALAVAEGAGALDCFVEALHHEDMTTAKWGAYLIGQVKRGSELLPELVEVANERWDEPNSPRVAIAKTLAWARDPRAVPFFRKGVLSEDRRLREQSALGLALLKTDECQEILDDALRRLPWRQARAVRKAIRAATGVNQRQNRATV